MERVPLKLWTAESMEPTISRLYRLGKNCLSHSRIVSTFEGVRLTDREAHHLVNCPDCHRIFELVKENLGVIVSPIDNQLCVSLTGVDCPGLIQKITNVVVLNSGQVDAVRFNKLDKCFTCQLSISVPPHVIGALTEGLGLVSSNLDLTIDVIDPAEIVNTVSERPTAFWHIELLCRNRSGLLHAFSSVIVSLGGNIEHADARTCDGTLLCGTAQFRIQADVSLPIDVEERQVREAIARASVLLDAGSTISDLIRRRCVKAFADDSSNVEELQDVAGNVI